MAGEALTTMTSDLTRMGLIDLDLTAVVSGLIFIGLLLVLRSILFNPYIRIVEKRESLTEGRENEAVEMKARAEQAQEEYEEKLKEARLEAEKIREDLRAKGHAKEEEILGAAREQVEETLLNGRDELASQVTQAEEQIETRARELSGAIVARLSAGV